jgi:hypothetical protein
MGTWYLLIPIWVLSLILIVIAAHPRGQSSILWFLLALLFGPVAIVILLLLPRPSSAAPAAGPASASPDDRAIQAIADVYKARSRGARQGLSQAE